MGLDLRCVFDTNVTVSALLFEDSVPGKAFYAALDRGAVLLSHASAAELAEVLGRKKFDRYLTLEERNQFLAALLLQAAAVEITEEVRACRDPKDDKFLALALSGKASCLITGDADLLHMSPFRGIPIVTPAQFLADLAAAEETDAADVPAS